MTGVEHTPGPWQQYSDYMPDVIIGNIDGPDDGQMNYTKICEIEDNAWTENNARLIAAAPDLLEALEEFSKLQVKGHALIDRLQFSNEGRALAVKINDAIAKARGRS